MRVVLVCAAAFGVVSRMAQREASLIFLTGSYLLHANGNSIFFIDDMRIAMCPSAIQHFPPAQNATAVYTQESFLLLAYRWAGPQQNPI